MMNRLVKQLLKKEIVLISLHRQTLPVIRNNENKSKYVFVNTTRVWRLVPFSGKRKMKYRLVYILISLIQPKYIIDINWTTPWQGLYKVWTKNHPGSTFMVIQHGAYIGGKVMDIAHRYTKCDEFLVWSPFFEKTFKDYNTGKRCKIRTFGNPVYNEIKRSTLDYKVPGTIIKILVAPSVQKDDRLQQFYSLISLLDRMGFEVHIKQHNYQVRNSISFEGVKMITGNLSEILMNGHYDLFISDYSTSLLDAIFFKLPVLYFNPPEEDEMWNRTVYSSYLTNLADSYKKLHRAEDFVNLIDIPAQEKLLNLLVKEGHNAIDSR